MSILFSLPFSSQSTEKNIRETCFNQTGKEELAVVLLITGLPPVQVEPPIKYLFWPAKLSIPAIVMQFPHLIVTQSFPTV